MDPKPQNDITITVDWNNPQSLNKAIVRLNKRRHIVLKELGFEAVKFDGSRYNVTKLLPIFEAMYSANLTDIYRGYDEHKIHYVYFHCDPRKTLTAARSVKHLFLATQFSTLRFEPFYVGKGSGNRYLDLTRNDTHRKIRSQLLSKKMDVIPVKVVSGLTEGEAFALESKLIDILGLKALSEHGMLVNLDEGLKYEERRAIYGKETADLVLKKNGFPV